MLPFGAAAEPLARTGWQIEWTSPTGYYYQAEMEIDVAGNGTAEGRIRWKLVRSPQSAEQPKLGMTAIEFVHGRYDEPSGVLALEGYKKEDPNAVIGLDRYRLVLAPGGTALVGASWNHGNWRGVFAAHR